MGMPQATGRWTADMVRALPDDGNRYEVVDGELLVTPSPRRDHQRAVREIAFALHQYVERQGIGEMIFSPSDIELDPRSMVQPDVFVFGLLDGRIARGWNSGAPLLLVVEVLSRGTARADRTVKRKRYQRAGIPEYWIVDLDDRVIEAWRPEDSRPELVAHTLEWRPAGAGDAFALHLPDFFAKVLRS